jgi:hypothetical protein
MEHIRKKTIEGKELKVIVDRPPSLGRVAISESSSEGAWYIGQLLQNRAARSNLHANTSSGVVLCTTKSSVVLSMGVVTGEAFTVSLGLQPASASFS